MSDDEAGGAPADENDRTDAAGRAASRNEAEESGRRMPRRRSAPGRSDDEGAAVHAERLGLVGPHGPVFTDVRLDAAPGALVAAEGPAGSGRTCLLLALTGRMKPSSGRAEVGGHPLPKKMAAVRRISGVGSMPGVTDLDPSLSVAEHLRERVLLQRRFVGRPGALLLPRRRRAADVRERAHAALDAVGLDPDELPKGSRTRVRDLERLDELRLSLALALVAEPRVLAVDDVELGLPAAEREAAWDLLRRLAAAGTTVLAACTQAPPDAVVVRTRPDHETDRPEREEGEESGDAFAETGRA